MAIRERLRRAFKSSSSDTSSLKKSDTSDSQTRDARYPSNVYAPGETMPRPKYRAPVKKEHKEKLEAFSWGTAWRRRSHVSEYSPMGSRMPSRRASLISRKSIGGKSTKSRLSVGGPVTDDGLGPESRLGTADGTQRRQGAARPTRLSAEIEAEGDDDVANVGLSRVNSRDRAALSRQQTHEDRVTSEPHKSIDAAVAHDHRPFTEEDLALAMKRSHLAVSTQS